jgi:gliding motility-associated-like protein
VIPINVRFEIWDNTNTNLLASGDTGNITSTPTPEWNQYALVFQTLPGQTSVILKMLNNGVGGCGNDVAIDDIVFKSCGDAISVEDASNNDSVNICSSITPYDTSFTAMPDNSVFTNHFYQWQESLDGVTWVDIAGATNQTLNVTGVTTTTYYRAKVAEFAANLNNSDCITFSDVYEVIVTQAPNPPTLECWETATFNNATCSWDVTGDQPAVPTGLECWETATFNNATCFWEVTGTQPAAPTGLECWEAATFNNTTCVWDITGTQPAQPTLECWETAIFNNVTCVWDVTGTQPVQPTLECWETATFNDTTCVWDISGTQPSQPTLECWETTTFNNTTCTWDVSGTQPTEPVMVNCWDDFQFNDSTCLWENIGNENDSTPIIESATSDGFNLIITISNTEAGDFEYSVDGVFYQSSNIFSPLEGGQYTIYARNSNGCGDTVSAEHLHFVIPSFFTPNGDAFKDTFDLKGIEFYASNEVYIFDRYGKLLKSSKDQAFKWNGTFNGEKLPSADYWYIIIINGQRFAGHFTLKR